MKCLSFCYDGENETDDDNENDEMRDTCLAVAWWHLFWLGVEVYSGCVRSECSDMLACCAIASPRLSAVVIVTSSLECTCSSLTMIT